MTKVYLDFTGHVQKARKLTEKQVDALARGRVWTGQQAKELSLVDELGGLNHAHSIAGRLAGIEPQNLPQLVDFPKKKSPTEQVVAVLQGTDENAATVSENAMPSLLHQLLEGSGVGEIAELWMGLVQAGNLTRKARASTKEQISLEMEFEPPQ
mmetsp:Transcript_5441/g.8650  ORF Transcript_5441/g.8650 Transcript_5441/m.8650 type:complete len:154 (+) Transcript_5441:1430-1891(+)